MRAWGARAIMVLVIALALYPMFALIKGFVATPTQRLSAPTTAVEIAPAPLADVCGENEGATRTQILLITSLNNLDVSAGTESLNIGLCIGSALSHALRHDECKPALTLSVPAHKHRCLDLYRSPSAPR